MGRKQTGPDPEVRAGVLSRALWHCERCGGMSFFTPASVHHRQPRGMGGSRDPRINLPSNLVLLCGSGTTGCHGEVESNRTQAIEDGWLVPRPFDPREIPIVELDGRAWFLDDDFGKTGRN